VKRTVGWSGYDIILGKELGREGTFVIDWDTFVNQRIKERQH